jgi:hypothetical protein
MCGHFWTRKFCLFNQTVCLTAKSVTVQQRFSSTDYWPGICTA